MIKKSLFIILSIPSFSLASVIINPGGGTSLPPGGTAGQCLKTDGGSPPTYSWEDCGSSPSGGNFVLLEDGTPPTPPAINYVLLEDGTYFLLEDSSKALLEQ